MEKKMSHNQEITSFEDEEMTIDLGKLAKIILDNIGLVIGVALLVGSLTYVGTKLFVSPTYRSSFTAYVNNRSSQEDATVTSSDVVAARSLANTFSAILVSRPMLEEAAHNAGIKADFEKLEKMVKTSTVDNTEIIQVDVVMKDPYKAKAFAKALAKASPKYVSEIVEGSSLRVVAKPQLPTKIYKPNYKKNALIGVVLGAVLMIAVIVIKELVDDRVKSENELEERYGIAVMGTIPDLLEAQKKNGTGYEYRKVR